MSDAQMQRTTIKLNKNLKRLAERKALEEGKTLQKVVNDALYESLFRTNKKVTFDLAKLAKPMGKMGNLTREEIYDL